MRAANDDLTPYLEQLERVPFVRAVRAKTSKAATASHRQPVTILRLDTPTRSFELHAELKRTHLTHALAAQLVHAAHDLPGLIVLAPTIGRELGDLFARERVNFVDLAGNCYLRLGDQYIARIQGQRTEAKPSVERALRAPAYRVLFALLADRQLASAPLRTLAEAAGGVSPQTAKDLRARLVEGGELLETKAGLRWAANGYRRGLDLFLTGWSQVFSTLVLGRFRAQERDPERLEEVLAPQLASLGSWRWGGGAAARRLTGYYRGATTLVYVQKQPSPTALRKLPLVPDRDGPVILAQAISPLAFQAPRPDVVHPLVVYADLLAERDDRAREAGAEVFRQYLESEAS